SSPSPHDPGTWKPIGPTRNLRSRTALILRWLERTRPGERSKNFYRAVCMFAEIELEGKLKPHVSDHLLLGAARTNGLVAAYGIEACRETLQAARAKVRAHYPNGFPRDGDEDRGQYPSCTPLARGAPLARAEAKIRERE